MTLKNSRGEMLSVLYIYRHPDMGYSIGRVFNPIEEEMKKYAEVDSIYLPVPYYSLKGLWKNISTARKAVRQKHYDIVHITGAEHYLIPFLREQKVVVTVHDIMYYSFLNGLKKRIWKKLFISVLKKTRYVTFISEFTKQQVISVLGYFDVDNSVIPNGVDSMYHYWPKRFNEECPVILHIGSLARKNLYRTIEAIAGLKCKLRIIGRQPEGILDKLRSYDIDYSIVYGLTDKEVLEEYKRCDIVSFVSLFEGFGMPLLEGQSVGRVVITSNISPMKEIAGEGAVKVDPFSVEEMHDAYVKVIHDKKLREATIRHGIENTKRYQLETVTQCYFEIYKKCIREKDY